jgi:glyoxylase-like metal-dependent hydrolase (beta-lactamase superfamily II)
VLYLPREKAMIVGDHLLPKITPHVGYTPGSVANPLGDFLASQRKVQEFDVALVLPAHGGVFTDHRHRANQIIQHHQYRLQEMIDVLRHAPETGYDVARRVFSFDWDSALSYQFPATFETLAHLEYLRHQGKVAHEERDGKRLYRLA